MITIGYKELSIHNVDISAKPNDYPMRFIRKRAGRNLGAVIVELFVGVSRI